MEKFKEFKLALASFPRGKHQMEFHLGKQFFADMENPDIHDADLKIDLILEHSHDVYDLTFNISGLVTLLCDRCLGPIETPINTTYHIAVEFGDSYNDESDDLLIIPSGDPNLNVAHMIHDTVALAIPMKHIHPQGQCDHDMSDLLNQHLATMTEEDIDQNPDGEIIGINSDDNSGIDPRWDELKKLTDNN